MKSPALVVKLIDILVQAFLILFAGFDGWTNADILTSAAHAVPGLVLWQVLSAILHLGTASSSWLSPLRAVYFLSLAIATWFFCVSLIFPFLFLLFSAVFLLGIPLLSILYSIISLHELFRILMPEHPSHTDQTI